MEALEQLREALNLESLPLRIECFDISNLQGREIVGSMAVFQDGQSKRAHYRSFGVRGQEGQDDFAAIGEVVGRRFARLREGTDDSFGQMPNLVVIDGGKGQLAAALDAIAQSGGAPRVAVVALAKREEEVFVPGRAARFGSIRTMPGCSSCSGSATRPTASRSVTIAGGGTRPRSRPSSTRSRASARHGGGRSCRHFGSAERFVAASQEELEGVPGLPAKTARAVYAQLHKTGSGSGRSGLTSSRPAGSGLTARP